MKFMKNLVCPISDQRVNKQVTRFNALLVISVVTAAFILNSVILLVFLMADFFIRAFTEIKFSPLNYTSHYLSNALNLPIMMIDKAPRLAIRKASFISERPRPLRILDVAHASRRGGDF